MGKFDGKIALVTGASSGIGAAMAREFAKQGADVVLTARRLERLEDLAKEIEAMGRRALPIACDVTQDEDFVQVVKQTHETFGKFDIVVANAGIGVQGKLEDITVDDYKRQNETNVYGVLRTIYATLDDLKETKGRLAIVGSGNSYFTLPGYTPYGISKYAVRALCEGLVHELKPAGVSVTLICPGLVASEIRQVNNAGTYQQNAKDPAPPWLIMPAEKAARQIVQAIFKRKRERFITKHVRVLVWLRQFTPWLFHLIVSKSTDKILADVEKPT